MRTISPKRYVNTILALRHYNCLAGDFMYELLLITHDYYLLSHFGKCIDKQKRFLIKLYKALNEDTINSLQYSFCESLEVGYYSGYEVYKDVQNHNLDARNLSFIEFFVLQNAVCIASDNFVENYYHYTYREFKEILDYLLKKESIVIKCSIK